MSILSNASSRLREIKKAFGFAFEGIAYTFRTQNNMRIHVVIASLVIVLSFFLRLSSLEWAVILICISLVLVTEMLNTAIEAIVDLISPDLHPLAKAAKDIGAGMVVIFSFLSAIIGCIVFVVAILRFL